MSFAPKAEEGHPRPGFIQMQYDDFFALLTSLGGTRGAVAATVIREQFGALKRVDGSVPVVEIAEATETHPDSVRETARRMVKEGMLERTENGRFRYVCDARRWVRMPARLLAWARKQRRKHAPTTPTSQWESAHSAVGTPPPASGNTPTSQWALL